MRRRLARARAERQRPLPAPLRESLLCPPQLQAQLHAVASVRGAEQLAGARAPHSELLQRAAPLQLVVALAALGDAGQETAHGYRAASASTPVAAQEQTRLPSSGDARMLWWRCQSTSARSAGSAIRDSRQGREESPRESQELRILSLTFHLIVLSLSLSSSLSLSLSLSVRVGERACQSRRAHARHLGDPGAAWRPAWQPVAWRLRAPSHLWQPRPRGAAPPPPPCVDAQLGPLRGCAALCEWSQTEELELQQVLPQRAKREPASPPPEGRQQQEARAARTRAAEAAAAAPARPEREWLESWAHPCRLRQLVEKQLQAEVHQVVIQ